MLRVGSKLLSKIKLKNESTYVEPIINTAWVVITPVSFLESVVAYIRVSVNVQTITKWVLMTFKASQLVTL